MSETPEAASDRITLRFLAGPSDVTVSGQQVPAGRVLEWIDRAAYACAVGWSGTYCVTAYVGDVHFRHPIHPGDLVQVHARIALTGRSSMHVLVQVESSDVRRRTFSESMSCLLVMVAVDSDGVPTEVPDWEPWSDGDRTLSERTRARIEPRRNIQQLMLRERYTEAGTAPRTVFRFLAAPSDTNWGGNAHGGTVMRWMDETAFACAAGWSSPAAVAVYAGGIQFLRPIRIGNLVEIEARLLHTSERSMHISIQVRSGPPDEPRALELTTHSITIFVDAPDGRALPIAPLPLVSDEDARLDQFARTLVELRGSLSVIPNGLARD